MLGFFKRRRRERLRSQPFPPAWREVIAENVPIALRLPVEDRPELEGLVQIFLAEKHFEGCGGLVLSEQIRVTIAAQACVLLLHRETDIFPRLITILVYPSSYVVNTTQAIGAGVVLEGEQVRLGEAWKGGVVVLSWKEIQGLARGIDPGQNLVLHEFAHLLDMEDGSAEGTPPLEGPRQYAAWKETFEWEYQRLRRDWELGRYSVLDQYGATNPAEFFAVATEAFFEKSALLCRRHPELYEQLKGYYRQDPARWPVQRAAAVAVIADDPDEETSSNPARGEAPGS
jgi:Mlc titration factor MtfA (ptsG expression regulator)